MLPNQIPSALEIFNKETIEKRNNVREIIGLKRIKNSCGGLYGVDFCFEKPSVNKLDYIPCLEKSCSFRGPSSMMEFHIKTVHEAGLEKRFDVESEAWRADRRKNYPRLSNPKPILERSIQKFEKKKRKHHQDKMQSSNIESISSDPMLSILNKKPIVQNSDLLGLGALYGSDDEETDNPIKISNVNPDFIGLPMPQDLDPKLLVKRRNRFRFPILPQMELQTKRNALMNPQRSYQDKYNRKSKRPRLADLLLAEEIDSERNIVLQCIRYLVNKRFYDPSLQHIPNTIIRKDCKIIKKDETEEEMLDDIFVNDANEEDALENEEAQLWSDDDLE